MYELFHLKLCLVLLFMTSFIEGEPITEFINWNTTYSDTPLFSQLSFGDIINGVTNTVMKARCLIPNDYNSISRAILLQQCISDNEAHENETACYQHLGCFPMGDPWVTMFRPFPIPLSPARIDVKLYLYTRDDPEKYEVQLWPEISLNGSDFDANRPYTTFIIHGFASNGDAEWLDDMKDAYLKLVDANIFIVDWGKGATSLNYLQVASNTRIVGAELTRFGKYLLRENVTKSQLHLIGHSLGSHIAGYMAKGLKSTLSKVGRITALDPAQPGFEGADPRVRLNDEDADFIDALHTDARPFIPFISFGMMRPVGHADFYVNGGSGQPGCLEFKMRQLFNFTSIFDLGRLPVEVLSKWVSCSHGRAYEIFTSTMKSEENCTLWGRKMPYIETFLKMSTLGKLSLADPLVHMIDSCTKETCSAVGLETPLFKARGMFASSTNKYKPYCETDNDRYRNLKNLLTGGLYGVAHGLVTGVSDFVSGSVLKPLGLDGMSLRNFREYLFSS